MSGLINSSLNGSASNLQDNSGRSFATSFSGQSGAASPVFHHNGGLQGLHNLHGNYNFPNIAGTLASRNSSMNNIPAGGVQQPAGSLSNGRFAANNLPIALSQISHGSSLGHSGISNRGGLGASPILGNAGPRLTSSIGNMVGGNIGRNISSGGGLSVPSLSSRLNLSSTAGSGSLGVQGQNRLMGGVLPQGSAQAMSMFGNSYGSTGGPLSQSHVQGVNNLNSMGMLNDVNSNDSSPFDINLDFPQLTSRPSSAGGAQGQLVSMRKQNLSPIVQQNQEFSIQNEDFPALPGFKGGSADYSMDLHQKEQLHDNSVPMMQPQHFSMGRSAGFSLGGAYSSHRPQQQQHASSVSSSNISFSPGNNQDFLHLHGSDLFPSSNSAFHSQTSGPLGVVGFRPLNSGSTVNGMGSYDQLIQQYQNQNQSQFRLHQMSAASQPIREQSMKPPQAAQSAPDPFGLLGLLVRLSDPDIASLALGIDLTTMGLSLNSSEELHKTFGSPWSDEPSKGDPEFNVPQCYYAKQPPALHPGYFSKFTVETLFYIFYSMPKDEAQLYAANELHNRGWLYHKDHRLWLMRVPNMEPLVKTNTYERASYHCLDPHTFEIVRKDNFVLQYDKLEKRPALPQH
ncbi:hypothetical protein SAY86_002689 [Trapa natans]|uniref:NOT2/NOT3/NOT5 C-terminal domain-containing protein n=1 Tax=Trapa natans TaxID=22666 RepID=A0AAN7LI90_TRANT|nr:hypothetical protein SAY86_002689 [Trapa natans]